MSIDINSGFSKSSGSTTENSRVESGSSATAKSVDLASPFLSVDVPFDYDLFGGDDVTKEQEEKEAEKQVQARQGGSGGSMSDSNQQGQSQRGDSGITDSRLFDADVWLDSLANSPNAMILMIEILNMMKYTMREQQRTESVIRMEKYTAALDMAFQKHDHIKEAAIEIKELKDRAADMKFNMGATKIGTSFLGSNSGIASGAFEMWEAKIQEVMNQAEKVQMDHQAQVALEDGLMSNYDKQANLANTQFAALEDILKNIMSSVSQLQQIDDRGRSGIVRTMA